MTKRYERKNKKNYHQWVLEHRDEIIALPNKDRTDYVMGKLKDELNLEMKRSNVYQLLYRNGMINHKLDFLKPATVIETTETTIQSSDEEPEEEATTFITEPCNFRERLIQFFGPKLLEKITFIDNSDEYDDSSEEPFGYGEGIHIFLK